MDRQIDDRQIDRQIEVINVYSEEDSAVRKGKQERKNRWHI